jgi:hypothetical protein
MNAFYRGSTASFTLIVITSDHGDLPGGHWQFGKHSYFDQSIPSPIAPLNFRFTTGPKIRIKITKLVHEKQDQRIANLKLTNAGIEVYSGSE